MPDFTLSCPIPISDYPWVSLAHGGGARLTHQLIEKMLVPSFQNPLLQQNHDGAVFEIGGARLAFTTDTYVVNPIFFPGGDIGKLAVNGTVNDLAMCGARPLFIGLALIIEEGFPMEDLWRVVQSISQAAENSGVQVVTGDTKVVDKGKGDGIFINTSGIGVVRAGLSINPSQVRPNDAVLLSGDIGSHGMAIMAQREGLDFETIIESDTAPLSETVLKLIDAGVEVHCLRDLTRGGLVTALVEIAEASGAGICLEERVIPVRSVVRGACEILGLDPLYVANEGRYVAFVAPKDAEMAIEIMRGEPSGAEAVIIGEVSDTSNRRVTIRTVIGGHRVLDMLSGEQLPRIC